jgi:superfamily II DNA or RNA helicase
MIQLEHINLLELYRSGVFNDLKSLQDLESNIEVYSKNNNTSLKSSEFKGMVFEIFNEFFLKKHGESKFNIIFDETTSEDKWSIGIDSIGISNYGHDVYIQSKYRSKHEYSFNSKDLSTFTDFLFSKFKHSDRTRGVLITNVKNDNSIFGKKALSYNFQHDIIDCIIGRDELIDGTNYDKFWTDFNNSILYSLPKIKTKNIIIPHEFQELALSKIKNEIYTRGQINMPTGTGKTYAEILAAQHFLSLGNEIILIIGPRISLIKQLYNNFRDNLPGNWDSLVINSGSRIKQNIYNDTDLDYIIPTTDDNLIIKKLKNYKNNLLIFTTNDSSEKLSSIFEEIKIHPKLIIIDEAHNFTTEEYNKLLMKPVFKSSRWLFFTASRKIDDTGTGLGMNNIERFGKPLYELNPNDAQTAGLITGIMLQTLNHSSHFEYDDNKIEHCISIIKSSIDSYTDDEEIRILVCCKNANIPHNIAESKEFQVMLPDYFISAISSNGTTYDGFSTPGDSKRDTVFDKFSKSKKSILLHYDVVSEGINLPGITSVIIMRKMNNIKIIQVIGRGLRIIDEDRQKLKDGTIEPNNSNNWTKPYCYIVLPYINDDTDTIKSVVKSLRSNDFSYDVEHITISDESDTEDLDEDKKTKNKITNDSKSDLSLIDTDLISNIENEISIEYENVEHIEYINNINNIKYENRELLKIEL